MIRGTREHEGVDVPLWTVNMKIEMLTRLHVRSTMEAVLSNQLPNGTLQELEEVLFGVLYPAYT